MLARCLSEVGDFAEGIAAGEEAMPIAESVQQPVNVMEFDSLEAARNWYRSPQYRAVVGERHASADTNAVIVGGFEMPST